MKTIESKCEDWIADALSEPTFKTIDKRELAHAAFKAAFEAGFQEGRKKGREIGLEIQAHVTHDGCACSHTRDWAHELGAQP